MNIVFLDAKTLGDDVSLDMFNDLGNVTIYDITAQNETLNRVKDADVVVTNKVVIDSKIMENSNIKLICVAATGMNNIDLEEAKNRAIQVKNVAGYSTDSVVQLTFSFVFNFLQKIDYYSNYVKENSWADSKIFTHLDKPVYELGNKKWGVIGLGTIGEKVASIAKSFGCDVNYYSTSGANNNTNYNMQTLEELLSTNDIISIHSPLNEKTLNLLNKTNLNMIKDGSILLNLGRGGIINEEDLAELLIGGKELYCGIDVVSKEPIEENNPLNKIRDNKHLIMTPHIGWGSVEARRKLVKMIYDNIKSSEL